MKLRIDFWDVGQGDCSVVTLPDGSLVIIDTGPSTSRLAEWLDYQQTRHRVNSSVTLVLTHNDLDHCGGALSVIDKLGSRWTKHFMTLDAMNSNASEQRRKLYQSIKKKAKGQPDKVKPLLVGTVIHQSTVDGREIIIECVHPPFTDWIGNGGTKTPQPNKVSGVVCLRVDGNPSVSWGGDAKLSAVAENCGSEGTILVGPHHGAPEDKDSLDFPNALEKHRPKNVWISVGAGNPHNHPVPDYLRSHSELGSRVRCSQLRHCSDEHWTDGKHVLSTHGSNAPRNHYLDGKPVKHVYCRGAIQWNWDDATNALIPDENDEDHMAAVMDFKGRLCCPSPC